MNSLRNTEFTSLSASRIQGISFFVEKMLGYFCKIPLDKPSLSPGRSMR